MAAILTVDDLTVSYEDRHVLKHVSLRNNQGQNSILHSTEQLMAQHGKIIRK